MRENNINKLLVIYINFKMLPFCIDTEGDKNGNQLVSYVLHVNKTT
jgi:hypothetical protein